MLKKFVISISLLSTTAGVITGCASTPSQQSINEKIAKLTACTDIGTLQFNGFDKKSHLFNRNDPAYKSYAPAIFNHDTRLNTCTPAQTSARSVQLIENGYHSSTFYGSYAQNSASRKVFELFLTWANMSPSQRLANQVNFNQQLAVLKSNPPASKKLPDWYLDIEQKTQQPVLVSNATNPELLGMMSNRTIALTATDVQALQAKMADIW